MPLKLNVGLSRKIGEANYGSRGASVNVELEADSSLVADPAKFQARIKQLFGLVQASITQELNNGQAASNPEPPSKPGRPATQSQVKALHAITRSQKRDLTALLRERFQLVKPQDLSLSQASALIDELKNGNGEGR